MKLTKLQKEIREKHTFISGNRQNHSVFLLSWKIAANTTKDRANLYRDVAAIALSKVVEENQAKLQTVWHPASEPPKDDRHVLARNVADYAGVLFYAEGEWMSPETGLVAIWHPTRWTELPQ